MIKKFETQQEAVGYCHTKCPNAYICIIKSDDDYYVDRNCMIRSWETLLYEGLGKNAPESEV